MHLQDLIEDTCRSYSTTKCENFFWLEANNQSSCNFKSKSNSQPNLCKAFITLVKLCNSSSNKMLSTALGKTRGNASKSRS